MAKATSSPAGVYVRTATLVVAASNSSAKSQAQADLICDGIDDQVTIQAALAALPAVRGEVHLLEGIYNISATINLDTNQTLRGCGRNTILTTATANLIFLSAVGGAGTEKTGIVIADLQIDGGAGSVSDRGIYFNYVDYSFIQNVYSRRHNATGGTVWSGIYLLNSDFNQIVNNTCPGNNVGIYLTTSNNNTILGNTCPGNNVGIYLNTSNNNTILGNTCRENSQAITNTYDDIYLVNSDYNNIQGNTCRAGALANKPRYGINISNAACDGNLVTNNDLYNDGFGTGSFNDAGTGTRLGPQDPTGRTATLVVAASDSSAKSKAQAEYVCDGVDDQVQINIALAALPAGGGEVYLLEGTYIVSASISIGNSQSLIGCGPSTVLKVVDGINANLNVITNSDRVTGNNRILLKDFKINGNRANRVSGVQTGIYFGMVGSGSGATAVPGCIIENIWAESCYGRGIGLYNCANGLVANCTCLSNHFSGILVYTSHRINIVGNICQHNCIGSGGGIELNGGGGPTTYCTIVGNLCEGNVSGEGIYAEYDCHYNSIVGNTCVGNMYDGIYLYYSNYNNIVGNIFDSQTDLHGIYLDNSHYNNIRGNSCLGNDRHGIYVSSSNHNAIVGNTCLENSQEANATYDNIFLTTSDYNLITGNICRRGALTNKPRYGINISSSTCDKNVVQGNDLYDAGSTANFNNAGTCTIVQDDNRDIEITDVRIYARVKNTSGASLANGDLVILKAVATGNEITTTTVAGNQLVFGMVAETIANNAYGYVQTKGKTIALKVNGTTAIAIGDYIGTYTTAKIGMKAASGNMAFAIALEAYAIADSLGVIDALIITPRQAV